MESKNKTGMKIEGLKGKVKSFKHGYGFLNIYENDELSIKDDIFVHYSKIVSDKKFKTLREGDIVEFDLIEMEDRRLRAENVRLIIRKIK